MRQPRLRTVLIATGTAIALVAGSTTAYAAVAGSPVDSSGVIHGCWTNTAINGSHVFVLQDAGTSCPKGTTAISWNQQGPAGPAGASGPQGPAGNTGPAGATGPQGPQGPPGQAGTNGTNGNTVLNGTGAPSNILGNNGDFYVDTAADVLYGPKTGGTWPTSGTSLVGNPGATGPAGPAGPMGPQGATGPAGPPGTGLSSLDALSGAPCNTGSEATGILKISYTYNADQTSASVAFTCVTTALDALTVTTAGTGTGTVTATPGTINCGTQCSDQYGAGTLVTLSETPGSESGFTGWSGDCTGTSPTCTVTMSQARYVTATFDSYTLTVTVTGTGLGGVGSTPTGIACQSPGIEPHGPCSAAFPGGATVTLTASPAPSEGYFAGWSGDCSGTSTTCSVTMSQARNVTADFEP